MIYFDTNVIIYAFSKNVDNSLQKETALSYVKKAIENDGFLISSVVLCEYAFIANKIKEQNINNILDYLKRFVLNSNNEIVVNTVNFLKKGFYKNSFDIYHLAFANEYADEIVTFDKDFLKFNELVDIKINLLRS